MRVPSTATKTTCVLKRNEMSDGVKTVVTSVGAPTVQMTAPTTIVALDTTLGHVIRSLRSTFAKTRLKTSTTVNTLPRTENGPRLKATTLNALATPYRQIPANHTSSRCQWQPHSLMYRDGCASPYRCTVIE